MLECLVRVTYNRGSAVLEVMGGGVRSVWGTATAGTSIACPELAFITAYKRPSLFTATVL